MGGRLGISVETRCFISSHPPGPGWVTARAHGGIETGLHWILDVAFREDARQVRTGHPRRNQCLLRRMALNLLRQDTAVKTG